MNPATIRSFFDPATYTVTHVVSDPATRHAAIVDSVLDYDPKSGRTMEVWSNQPGIQFYTGNFLDGVPGKDGAVYEKNGALCLETQAFPDSINKQGKDGWPNVVLRPGQTYEHNMVHRFTSAKQP